MKLFGGCFYRAITTNELIVEEDAHLWDGIVAGNDERTKQIIDGVAVGSQIHD
jgi:hypothetical protein